MDERIDGWSVTVEVNGDEILTIAHDCLGGHPDLIDKFAPYVRASAAHLLSFVGAGPDHVGGQIALAPGDALYTMDQMRDYAQSFHRSRTEHLRPRWVSVGDRLPEREQMVLVFRPDAHHRPACDPNIDVREYLGNGKFRSSHEVTHWMPLAAAPASVASKEEPTS